MDYTSKIKQIIRTKKKQLNLTEINSINVSLLGRGENNLNYLVKVNDQKLIFRIGFRKDLEKNMKCEFESLKQLPPDFGPKPLYFDNSKKILPKVYSILTYIEGKHTTRWTKKHLKLHAEKLAQLHKKKYSYWGKFHQKKKFFDYYKFFMKEANNYPMDTFDKELLPKVKEYVKNNNHLFTSLKKFSMIHTDPGLTNILFHKNEIHYIDWEWLRRGDNAEDLHQLFYTDHSLLPWKMKLSGKRKEYFLNEYLKHIKDSTLKQRVEVWEKSWKFIDLLYFKWRVKNYDNNPNNLSKQYYQKCINILTKPLNATYFQKHI